MASLPSSRLPRFISTNPPNIERAAEPDPKRANSDNSLFVKLRLAALLAATAKQANDEAEDANPAEVGKLLILST